MAKNITSIEIGGSEYTSRPFGVCTSGNNDSIKEVAYGDTFSLVQGATIIVQFRDGNSVDEPSLRISSSVAYPIYKGANKLLASDSWKSGDIVEFRLDNNNYWTIIGISQSQSNLDNYVTSDSLNTTLEDFLKTGDISWGTTSSNTSDLTIKSTTKTVSLSGHTHSYAPIPHDVTSTIYGAATTDKYGHVKISNGDLNGKTNKNGEVAGLGHSHGNYSVVGHVHISTQPDTTTGSTKTINLMEPNKLYRYTVACKSITVGALKTSGSSTAYEEYMLEFKADMSGCTLNLPADVIWVNNNPLEIIPGKIHQVSIVNNLAVGASFG